MKTSEIRKRMRDDNKTIIDICAGTKLSPNTVRSFLEEKKVNYSSQLAIENFVLKKMKQPSKK